MKVTNDELVSSRRFRGGMTDLLNDLKGGPKDQAGMKGNRHDKLVITRDGKMTAVVLSVEEYEKLVVE